MVVFVNLGSKDGGSIRMISLRKIVNSEGWVIKMPTSHLIKELVAEVRRLRKVSGTLRKQNKLLKHKLYYSNHR